MRLPYWTVMVLGWVLGSALWAAEPRVLFEDRFEGKLADGWSWLRENPQSWRIKDGALEIRVEPGVAQTVKNALLRKMPDRSKTEYAVEVTVTSLSPPTKQFEQAGMTWYQRGTPGPKLVHENIDSKTYIIPGRAATATKTIQLRWVAENDKVVAQFRPDAGGEFKTTQSIGLKPTADEQIGLTCYQGPADAEHWIRFDDFRIVELTN